MKPKIRKLAEQIAADLFTDGRGDKAERLRFDYTGNDGGTGWAIEPFIDRIEKVLANSLKSQRKATRNPAAPAAGRGEA